MRQAREDSQTSKAKMTPVLSENCSPSQRVQPEDKVVEHGRTELGHRFPNVSGNLFHKPLTVLDPRNDGTPNLLRE
jgi:hypothetical protein